MKKYKGFSLVEVLMLFAALSVILAITAPLVTKSSKDVPQKLPHGLYQCYRDANGQLHEEWYNSFRKIKDNYNATSCSFTPPEKTTMFKITLIGAGSGGYSYGSVEDNIYTTKTATYNPTTGKWVPEDAFIEIPGDDILGEIFNDVNITVCSNKAGDGGNACGVKQYYYPMSCLKCKNTDKVMERCNTYSKDNKLWQADGSNSCTYAQANINKLLSYTGKDPYIDAVLSENSSDYNNFYNICEEVADFAKSILGIEVDREKDGEIYVTVSQSNSNEILSATGAGGKGGKGKYAKKEYTLAKSVTGMSYTEYLKRVASAAKIGHFETSNTSKFIESQEELANGASCNCEQDSNKCSGLLVERDAYTAKTNKINDQALGSKYDGKDATNIAAIEWTDPITGKKTYETTEYAAKGGTAGNVKFNSSSGKWVVQAGTKGADGGGYDTCERSSSSSDNSLPELTASIQKLLKRYGLGNPGNPGNVEHYTLFDLGHKPCSIHVGMGSTAHKDERSADKNYGTDTTLSCAGIKLTAKGGKETNSTTYIKYSPKNTDKGKHTAKFEDKDVGKANFDYNKVIGFWLSRLKSSLTGYEFGKAGDGSVIYDNCSYPKGSQTFYLGGTQKKKIQFDGEKCTADKYSGSDENEPTKITAGAGMGGAIFIRW